MKEQGEICVSKKHENFKFIIIVTIALLILISILVAIININIYDKPEVDKEVKEGEPTNVDAMYGYSKLEINDGYYIAVCGNPKIENKKSMYLYATNLKDNKIWIKMQVTDENDNILGETGLIKPNQYVEKLELKEELATNRLKIKVVEYEMETYHNKGKITLNITV